MEPENKNISTHTLVTPADCDCGKETWYCPICDGGLAYCKVCKGGERELIEESCQERCRRLAEAPVMACFSGVGDETDPKRQTR